MSSLPITLALASVLSWIVIATEFFLSTGLWFKRTRLFTLIIGTLFHLSLLVMIDHVDIFQWMSISGYLAFLEKKPAGADATIEEAPLKPTIGKWEQAALIGFVLLMFWMPIRFFVITDRPLPEMLFADRTPWAWSMFVFIEQTDSVKIKYRTAAGQWVNLESSGRMNRAEGDNDLVEMARYVLMSHPQASEVTVQVVVNINGGHWMMTKDLDLTRNANGLKAVLETTSLRSGVPWPPKSALPHR